MSWTTAAPYSRQTVIFRKPVAEIAPATTPPPVATPSAQTTVTPINTVHAKPKRPLPPEKLAKLANALGVATPSPVSAQHPLFSPSSPGGSSVATSSAPSRYFLHVIPPLHLLLVDQESANDPYAQSQFRRGTLVSLHPTLQSQLGAIAREYSLPSTGGMILYLITSNNDPGPRLTEDAWRMLWYRALQMDKDGSSGGNHIARFHSRSVASSIHSPYPSPSTASGSPFLQSTSSLADDTPATSDFSSIDFSLDINPSSALPILAKIEFDIDRRKAPWYDMWKNRRRTTSLSTASSLQLSNGHRGSGTRALQLPERARSTSPSLAEFKAKYTSPLDLKKGRGHVQLDSSEESEYDNRNEGYVQLDDGRPSRKKKGMVHMGEFTDDPLEDVFPSDQATWAQIRVQRDQDGEGSPTTPQTPDIMIGGKIGSAILNLDDSHEDEESLDGDAEEVIAMWREKHKATLESPDSRSPSLNISLPPGVRSRSASRHVPPPLDLSKSPKSQIPHVEVAPPTATSARLSISSDLPYLDSEAAKKARAAGQDIQIIVDPTVGDDVASKGSIGSRRPSVSNEEARSHTLDELEKRIGNLSPNLELSNSTPVVTVEGTPAMNGSSSSLQDETAEATASQPSLSLPSTKASRRQVSMGSFNAIPGSDSLAEALANRPPSPEEKDDNKEQDGQEIRLQPPIDLSSAATSPTTPGFPLSPDPFGNKMVIGGIAPSKTPGAEVVTSPPPRMSSRFSTDSTKSDDAQSPNVRTPSIISVKGIRSLWRKSGNTKTGGPPLMSPGPNGQYSPTIPSATEPVPPLPSSTSTHFPPTVMGPPPVPPKPSTNNASLSGASNTSPTNASSPVTTNSASSHARSDSGTDPFHFDQESRYPVTRMPSPSQAFADHVPPSVIILDGPPPPTPTVPSTTPTQKKGILKGWGSKGSQPKRTSGEVNRSASPSNPPPSAFGSLGSGKKSRPSINSIVTGSAHAKTSSKASISSMSSTSKHNHVNSSLSGTSHASSHQGIPAMPSPPDSSNPQIPTTTGTTSPTPPTPTRKSTESSVGGLTPVTAEARKSTPPPPGAVAIAAAVQASRERRGTSYIGPPENRI